MPHDIVHGKVHEAVDNVLNGVEGALNNLGEGRAEKYRRRADRLQRRAERYGLRSAQGDQTEEALTPEERARRRAKQLRGFYTDLTSYLTVIALLFVIDLATGGGWWFYWPALGWGIAIVFHAVSVFGPQAMLDDRWEERKARELVGKTQPTADRGASASSEAAAETAELVQRGVGDVAQVRQLALRIPKPAVREQALAVCASADRVLAVLADQPQEPRMARDFVDRYLEPMKTIIGQYVRLSSRGVVAAGPTLAKVEDHDLPLLETKLRELYERLHRGDVIDLQVASEMLDLELAGGDEGGGGGAASLRG